MKAIKISVMLFLFSCSADHEIEPKLRLDAHQDHTIFARYSNCSTDCVELYAIQNGKLYREESIYRALPNSNREFVELTPEQYELARDIAESIPQELLTSESDSFGIGLAADRGVVYIEIKNGGVIRYCTIDDTKQDVPEYLHSLVDKIKETIDLLE